VWATYLGGKAGDAANSVALDSSGNVWISGTTLSADFPNAQGWSQGQDFLTALNPTGSALVYSGLYPNGSTSQSIAVDSAGLLHLAGPGGIVSAAAPASRPLMRAFGIANAAWGPLDGRISPGEVVSLYGPHIGPMPPAMFNGAGPVPKSLGGVQVFFNDIAAPVFYASDWQINAVVPFGIAGQSSARVRIVFNGTASPDFPAAVLPVMPQVFQNTSQAAVALNQDNTVNSSDHPAQPGSFMTIWATGVAVPAVDDGQIPTAAQDFGCCMVYGGDNPLRVIYGGAAPGIVAGVVQVNFQLSPDMLGQPSVTLLSNGRAAGSVRIFVAP